MLHWNLRERSSIIYRILHLLDCSLVGVFLFLLARLYSNPPWHTQYTYLLILSFVLSFISFQYFQLYRSWRGWKFYLEFLVIVQAWGTVVGILLLYFFIFKVSEYYSRAVFLIWSFGTPFLIFIVHFFVRKLLRHFRTQGKNLRHVVIVGAGDLGLQLLKEVETTPWAGIRVIGFFDDKEATRERLAKIDKPLLGTTDEVADYLKEHDIDNVYIALPLRAEKKIFSILLECRDLGAQIFLVPDLYAFGLHHAEIQSLGEMLVLSFNPLTSWKRSFDVIFSLLALLFGAPIFLAIALAIKLDSPGPVFYRHTRITSTGREFFCLKFRSMVRGADEQIEKILKNNPNLREEWEQTYKLKEDPRVTRIGRFLRRTSLDELPQFINVLRGEMSVVGARPIVGKELEQYYKANGDASAGRYCSMKPGITGPWQVMGRSDVESYQERIELDDWYVLNYSLATDLKIIFKTIRCMFSGKGAY